MSRRVLFWLSGVLVVAIPGLYAVSHFCFPGGGAKTSQPRSSEGPGSPQSAKSSQQVMDEAQRAYLWEIEHHGNVLGRHGFRALATALRQGDGAALARMLANDFTAGVCGAAREVQRRDDFLDVVRQGPGDGPVTSLTSTEFVDRLLALRRIFGPEPKAKLSLMTLAPVEQGKFDGPWRGTAQLRLWGEWDKGRPAEVIAYLQYQVRQPTEGNLAKDGWLSACTITQSQIGKARHYLFQETAAARGIKPEQFFDRWLHTDARSGGGGVFVCDYNRDGILDMLVTDPNGYFFFEGQRDGTFRDVTERVGLPRTFPTYLAPHDVAAFIDIDGDGWEDLLLGTRVFRNDAGRRFLDFTDSCTLPLPESYGALIVGDYDCDGRPDLYAVRAGPGKAGSWLDGKSGAKSGNVLLRNLGNWQFEDVTAQTATDGGQRSTFSAAWLDFDNDGWPDLYVINEFGEGIMYHNQGRGPGGGPVTFRPRLLVDYPCDFGSMGLTTGDVDNDGNIDIYVANMYSKAGKRVIGNVWPGTFSDALMARMRRFVTGSQLHRNLGGGRFEQLGEKLQVADCGWAYGPALADLDNDGWLDLYATAGFASRNRDEPDG